MTPNSEPEPEPDSGAGSEPESGVESGSGSGRQLGRRAEAVPVFVRVGEFPLYQLSSRGEAAVGGYWAGFRSGAAVDPAQPELSLDAAWQDRDGVYVFCGADPTGDPAAFLAALAPVVTPGTRFVWIADPSGPSAAWAVHRLAASPEGSGPQAAWRVLLQGRFPLGPYAVEIDAGTRLVQADPAGLGSGVAVVAGGGGGGGLYLSAPREAYEARPGTAWLPFVGGALGSWSAGFDFPHTGADGSADDLSRLAVQLRYAMPDPDDPGSGRVRPIPLPILSQNGHALTGRLAFDPIHPLLPARTALDIAPEGDGELAVRGAASSVGSVGSVGSVSSPIVRAGPPLGTSLRTTLGYRVLLSPALAQAPLRSARFVFCYSPLYTSGAPAYRDYYLAPDGAFALTFDQQSGLQPDHRLLLGLSGGEYVQLPDTAIVQFDAGRAAYAPSADAAETVDETGTSGRAPLTARDLLNGTGTTAYLSILPPEPGPQGLVYYAQPQQSPFYTAAEGSGEGFLNARPLPAAWLPPLGSADPGASGSAGHPSGAAAEPPTSLPVAGYAGISAGLARAARRLEETALAPARRAAIGDPPDSAGASAGEIRVVTPQGLVADVAAGDTPAAARWLRLVIASLPGAAVSELVFTSVGAPLRAALQTGELFLVVAKPKRFMEHASVRYGLDAIACDLLQNEGLPPPLVAGLRAMVGRVYENEKAFIAALPPGAVPDHVPAILKVAGLLKAAIEDWTFQLSPQSWRTEEDGAATIMIVKYAGRSLGALAEEPGAWGWPYVAGDDPAATRLALHDIFTAAAQAPEGSPYQRFYREVVADPAWNGVLFLNAPVSVAELPADLQFVTAGIDTKRFYAHHVGFSLTPVHAAGGEVTLGRTAAFGLLHYDDPADLVLAASVPFAFKTQKLSVRFAGGQIADLSAQVELMVNQLFGAELAIQQPDHGNNLVLAGAYQRQNGVPSYNFALTRRCDFLPGGSMLSGVEVSAVALRTSTGSAVDGRMAVDFALSGNLRFGEMPYFDLFSFGPERGAPEGEVPADGYLRYSGLVVRMRFDAASPGDQVFEADEGRIALDQDASKPREGSLAAKFPVRVKGLIAVPALPEGEGRGGGGAAGGVGRRPEDLGYASVLSPMQQSPLEPPWYGLSLSVDLGTLGALAGAAGLSATLLAGWATGEDRPAYLGLQLAGGPSDAGWPVQGVLRLGFRAFEFQLAEDTETPEYLLVLRHLALSLLGWSLPPGDLDLVLFGDPNAERAASLGWYAAYVAPDAKKPAASGPANGPASGQRALPRGADPVVRRLRSGRRALPPGSGLRGDPGPGPRLPEAVRKQQRGQEPR